MPNPLLKVLIAEDDKVAQKIYITALPAEVFELKIASNGAEALELFESWSPDIILLDFIMPIMNGYQVLQSIRQSDKGKKLTVIMVTSQTDKESIMACAELGLQGYIIKPFSSKDLAKKIIKIHSESNKTE